MIAQAVACALGVWLMAAPDVLGYGGSPRVNDLVIGPLAASFACVAIWEIGRSLRWLNVGLGVWLALSPLVLGVEGSSAGNAILTGASLTGLSLARGRLRHRVGGGWRELFSAARRRAA